MIVLAYCRELTAQDLNAIKLVEFLGGHVEVFRLTDEPVNEAEWASALASAEGRLIISAQTLFVLCSQFGPTGLQVISRSAARVFVYGFETDQSHASILRTLSEGEIVGVAAAQPGDCTFHVEPHHRNICKQLSGLSFDVANARSNFTFIAPHSLRHVSPLIHLGRKPFVLAMEAGSCKWMLSAGREIADLDQHVTQDVPILNFFSSVAPLVMFVAAACPQRVWHNDSPGACLVIDDPLLTQKYGCLDFRQLSAVMEREQFSTSLAFIPWNFRRSQRKVAGLFSRPEARLSLSVHGCDHTRGEFGIADFDVLCHRSRLALQRMEEHQRLTGLNFDRVMVFPQGIFSELAPKALGSSGYSAAVNTTPFPVDASAKLTLRNLLEPANSRFSGFPIFVRRPPAAVAELAFDLFLGKPAIIVAHHDYFRNGYDDLIALVRRVNGLDERLRWTNLAEVCSGSVLKRTGAEGDVYIQFATDSLSAVNNSAMALRHVFSRRHSPGDSQVSVWINGSKAESAIEGGFLTANCWLDPASRVDVKIEREFTALGPCRSTAYGTGHKMKVLVRRRLSEFRDNYLDKHVVLHRAARKLSAFVQNGSRRAANAACVH